VERVALGPGGPALLLGLQFLEDAGRPRDAARTSGSLALAVAEGDLQLLGLLRVKRVVQRLGLGGGGVDETLRGPQCAADVRDLARQLECFGAAGGCGLVVQQGTRTADVALSCLSCGIRTGTVNPLRGAESVRNGVGRRRAQREVPATGKDRGEHVLRR